MLLPWFCPTRKCLTVFETLEPPELSGSKYMPLYSIFALINFVKELFGWYLFYLICLLPFIMLSTQDDFKNANNRSKHWKQSLKWPFCACQITQFWTAKGSSEGLPCSSHQSDRFLTLFCVKICVRSAQTDG